MTASLRISDLKIAAQTGAIPLVKSVTLDLHAGETVAVVGESGSGKSLTALAILGLLPPGLAIMHGQIELSANGETTALVGLPERSFETIRGRRIGMIFQEPMSAFSMVRKVGDQIGEPLVRHQGLSRKAARSRAAELLDELDVADAGRVVSQYPFEFSGGMLQRAMIARAVACSPEIILADEPTTSLDVTVQAQVLRLLARVQQSAGSAMLFITHDLAVARQVADRIVVMRKGEIAEEGTADDILERPRAAYTRDLLAAVPELRFARSPEPPAADPILEVEKVSLTYEGTQSLFGRPNPPKQVLTGVTTAIQRGSIVGLAGESGSGKTTLARAILQLVRPRSGDIRFHARDGGTIRPQSLTTRALTPFWRKAQMVFQNPYASLNPWLSVEQALVEPLLHHGVASGAAALDQAARTLERCGMDRDTLSRFPHSFSGGQRQRIAIARALVIEPEFVVCDEPMSALDVTTQARIKDLLIELRETFGLTILIITHDLAAASQLCDRILVMRRGQIVEDGPSGQVFSQPQSSYTARLIAAVPTLSPRLQST